MKRIKRTLSVILIVALLLTTLSASAFAVDTVQIEFTVPKVGDTMHKNGDTFTANEEVTCTVQAVYTGDEIKKITDALFETKYDVLKTYANSTYSPSEYYLGQFYLIILRLTGAISSATTVSSWNVFPTGENSDQPMYVYQIFTPTADSNSDDGDSGSSGGESNNTSSPDPTTSSKDVRVSYKAEKTQEVVSVEVSWGEMKFTYSPATEGTWDPATHEYENSQNAKWSYSGNTITVVSHSNVPLNATLTYTPTDGFDHITGKFLKEDNEDNAEIPENTMTIPTAVGTSVENPPTATAYLILDGALDKNTAYETVSGKVTITIK